MTAWAADRVRGGGHILYMAPEAAIELPPLQPTCCGCCLASTVLKMASVLILLLGCAVCGVGIYINQRFHGWELSSLNLLGWLCIALGGVCVLLALLGLWAARRRGVVLFAYFLILLMVVSLLLLACVIAVLENDALRMYIQQNWSVIHARLGLGVFAGDKAGSADNSADGGDGGVRDGGVRDGELTLAMATALVQVWLEVIGGVGFGTVALLLVALGSAMRALGVRAIAMGFLASNAGMGLVEVGVAWATYQHVPLPTSAVLLGCAGVQLVCSSTGILGFKCLNRECVCCSLLVLLLAVGGLSYSAVAAFLWVRDVRLRHPEHLTLICGVSMVACLLLVLTLLFMALLYCRRRRAFTEAERTQQPGVEYSDYDERVKERRAAQRERRRAGGGGGLWGRKRRSTTTSTAGGGGRRGPSEYAVHEHL